MVKNCSSGCLGDTHPSPANGERHISSATNVLNIASMVILGHDIKIIFHFENFCV